MKETYEEWLARTTRELSKKKSDEPCSHCHGDPHNLIRANCICSAVHAPCHVCESPSITCPQCETCYTSEDT